VQRIPFLIVRIDVRAWISLSLKPAESASGLDKFGKSFDNDNPFARPEGESRCAVLFDSSRLSGPQKRNSGAEYSKPHFQKQPEPGDIPNYVRQLINRIQVNSS